MKIKITVFLMVINVACFAQKNSNSFFDTSIIITTGYGYSIYGDYTNAAYVDENNKLVAINGGDTAKTIMALIQLIKQQDSTIQADLKFVGAAVDFSNNVPDYWRTKEHNCAWPKYYGQLKKKGYKTSRIKNNNNTPCL